MGTHEHNELPVDERVVLELTASEAVNPRQAFDWWKDFEEDYPYLANEVRRRAYYNTVGNEAPSPIELYARHRDLAAFIAQAFKLIKERGENNEALAESPLSDDDGGEDPPPSA